MTFPFSSRVGQEAFTPAQLAFFQRQVATAEGNAMFPGNGSFPLARIGQSIGQAGTPRAPELVEIQQKLQKLGYGVNIPDSQLGYMTPAIALMIESFQRSKRLPLTKVFDKATVDAINDAIAALPPPPRAPLNADEQRIVESITSVARTADQLRDMQTKLQGLGYGPVAPGELGNFGVSGPSPDSKTQPGTFQMIQKFQIDQRLPANGVFNRETSDRLERVLSSAATPSASPVAPPTAAEIAGALANLRSNLAVQEQIARQSSGMAKIVADTAVQQTRAQIAALESIERTTVTTPITTSESGSAPARSKYLVPALVVGAVVLLAGGYLLSQRRA